MLEIRQFKVMPKNWPKEKNSTLLASGSLVPEEGIKKIKFKRVVLCAAYGVFGCVHPTLTFDHIAVGNQVQIFTGSTVLWKLVRFFRFTQKPQTGDLKMKKKNSNISSLFQKSVTLYPRSTPGNNELFSRIIRKFCPLNSLYLKL